MALVIRIRRIAAVLATSAICAWAPAVAQEVSDSHLEAARAAITAIKATDRFDVILPRAAHALKQELIRKNPDLEELITETVDQQALELAARRGDLEREAALAYARVFSEEHLTAIAEFYETEAGKKLIADGPIVSREVDRAAEIWQRGLARDLAQTVGQKLFEIVGSRVQSTGGEEASPDASPEEAAPEEGQSN